MREVTSKEVPSGAQLIDVREPNEYSTIHAAGAVNVPLSSFVSQVGAIDPSRDIYLICKGGGRSAQAGEYLEHALGWTNVVNVVDGTSGWVAAGLPTESE